MGRIDAWIPFAVLGAMALLLGCASPKVEVPPRADLRGYERIGLVHFEGNRDANLQRLASQRFLQAVQQAQPGARILELGDRERVLRAVEREALDFAAVQALGEKYGVDAVITGDLEFTDIRPKLDVRDAFASFDARAEIEGTLTARLWETRSGATLWTNAARGRRAVARVNLASSALTDFGANDPAVAHEKLVHGLVDRLTRDFWPTYR